MNITFKVEKQLICRTDHEIPVAKSENYLFAEFSFSDEWQGTKTAIFNNGTAYSVILEDNRCLVPWEVITANGFSVSVYCGNRITANTAYVMVIPSGYIEGETPAPPSPTVYDQLTEEISKKQDTLVSGENIKTINNQSLLGEGNKTSAELGVQDRIVITGTDGNDYAVTFGMDNGAPSVICEQVKSAP